MRWKGRQTSSNIEDRRGSRRMGGAARTGGIGILALVAIGAIFGLDVRPFLSLVDGGAPQSSSVSYEDNTIDDEMEEFVGVVLNDTETIWTSVFEQSGLTYTPPVLVLYSGVTRSGCGGAQAAMGPFYCPNDQRIFLDTDFFRVMEQQLGAYGEFAKAYVIAHEVAHHVQNSLGVLGQVHKMQARASKVDANALSVRIELQADCYSGVWARAVNERYGVLERGDIESALNAAAAIGDDALQRAQQGVVVPDSFTHGTSEQRQRWFFTGFETGDPNACDTFSARSL